MAIILLILIVFLIGLLIKNHDFKKQIAELSKQNEELTKKLELLLGTDPEYQSKDSGSKTNSDNLTDNKDHVDIPVTVTMHYDDGNDYQSDQTTTYDDSQWEKQNKEEAEMLDKYEKVQATRPDYNEQFGRPFDYPKYTDKYNTNTDFTLRELLLLVWWGKIKKGRLVSARIPRYFIYDYNLNVRKVTQKFIDKGWLVEKSDRYSLSEEARQVVDFYSDLWEMHQSSSFPICLDEDFPNWNHGKLLINFYNNEIEFQKKMIDFYKRLKTFYKNNPKFFLDKQMQDNHLQSVDESISEANKDIERDKKLIAAIE